MKGARLGFMPSIAGLVSSLAVSLSVLGFWHSCPGNILDIPSPVKQASTSTVAPTEHLRGTKSECPPFERFDRIFWVCNCASFLGGILLSAIIVGIFKLQSRRCHRTPVATKTSRGVGGAVLPASQPVQVTLSVDAPAHRPRIITASARRALRESNGGGI